MKTKLPDSIETIKEAKKFIRQMMDNKEIYHPEDPASIIIDRYGKRLFTDEESIKLDSLYDQVYNLDWNPTQFMINELKKRNMYGEATKQTKNSRKK